MKPKYQKNKIKVLCFSYEEFKELMKEFNGTHEPTARTYDNLAKFLGVTKILEIQKYNGDTYILYEDDFEDFEVYQQVNFANRIDDAKNALDNYFNISEDYGEYDSEELEEFKAEFGFDAKELYDKNSDYYILEDLAEEFFEQQDCNVAENDVWDYVIKITLAKFKM